MYFARESRGLIFAKFKEGEKEKMRITWIDYLLNFKEGGKEKKRKEK